MNSFSQMCLVTLTMRPLPTEPSFVSEAKLIRLDVFEKANFQAN